MSIISVKDLLEARIHFGHKVARWNPAMEPYIYGERRGIHIIDIRKTVSLLNDAYYFAREQAAKGKKFLFVGTKKQASSIIEEEAKKVGAFYVNTRWLGGTLTNFSTIKESIRKFNELSEQIALAEIHKKSKKEIAKLKAKKEKMEKYFSGLKNMTELPDVLYIVDAKKEMNAIHEANIMNIPVIAIIDTNGDPTLVNYPIPANDDAIESIQLITRIITAAIQEGMKNPIIDQEIPEKEEN